RADRRDPVALDQHLPAGMRRGIDPVEHLRRLEQQRLRVSGSRRAGNQQEQRPPVSHRPSFLSQAHPPDSVALMDRLARRLRNPLLALALILPAAAQAQDMPRWKAEAAKVPITRDSWGIAHVLGKTDADTVFGAIYAQAEDDFSRI